MAAVPTLYDFSERFGQECAALWVYGQVMALYGSSSNKDTGIADGIKIFADAFAASAAHYKLSELMLFFTRYKAGVYDGSYATFDARRIGSAFFKEFLPRRNMEIDRYEREATGRRIAAQQFTPPPGYNSLSWYEEVKRRAEAGDAEAKALLKPKIVAVQ